MRLKKWRAASRISRSLKVIGTDTDRSATYDFLLKLHSNNGPISYRFRDKRRFQSKIANFPHSPCLVLPLKGFPLEFGIDAGGQKKTRMMWLLGWADKEDWRYLQPSGYNTRTWRTDIQTDRRTDTGRQQRPRLSIASCGKNHWTSRTNQAVIITHACRVRVSKRTECSIFSHTLALLNWL